MAAFNKFQDFVEQLGLGVHNLNTHTIKAVLTNTEPVNTNTTLSQITQIGAGTGYTTGGEDIQNLMTESPAGTATMTATDVVWTATGSMGPFQYVVLYNDDATSPLDALVGWYDYGSAVTLASTETFTLDFGASVLTIT